MKKIYIEVIFFILCIISVLGTILSFIFLLQYIPEYFIYINNNWNNGYTDMIQKGMSDCKFPLYSGISFNLYKDYQKNFFNKLVINDNMKNEDNIKKYYFKYIISPVVSHCILNRTNYFDTKLSKYKEGNDFENCKFIDSLNNTSCGNYTDKKRMTIVNSTKYTEVIFGQAQPCFDPRYYNLYNITFDKTSYYYDKKECPGGRVSKHYVLLKDVTLRGIIVSNTELGELGDKISDEIKNQTLYIYGRNYIGIKDECRSKPFKNLNSVIEQKNNYIKSSINWIGYIVIVEIIFFLLFINRFSVKYHNYINNINKEKDHQNKEILPPYTKPMILILSFIMLGFHVLVFTYFLNIRDYIDLFKDISCFEEEAGELIKPSVNFLISAKYIQMIVLAINIILAFKFGLIKIIKYAN